jgi:hypothetical protein
MGVDDEGAKSDPDHAVVTTPAAACDLRIEYSTAIIASSATLSLPQHKDRRVLFLSQTNTRIFADATKRRPPHSATLTAETQRTRPSSPARLHARRALAHALPPTAAAADLTHIFRTPLHWSSASRSYQTWKAPAPTQRYTSTMPSVPCARRSRSPRSTSPSTRWRMDPR